MPAGRPTDYRPEYCDRVIELGRRGDSRAEIAAELDVARYTLKNWENEHPEFLDAMTRAYDLALAVWMRDGRKGMWAGSQFNANAYSLQVRNRFRDDYVDKQERAISGALDVKQSRFDFGNLPKELRDKIKAHIEATAAKDIP